MLVIDGVEMLDVREVARMARRSPETVRRWVWSGRLTARRQGNRLLVARRDVDNLLREGQSAGPALTLAEWTRLVADHRRDDALGPVTAGASAADLVITDRRARDDD